MVSTTVSSVFFMIRLYGLQPAWETGVGTDVTQRFSEFCRAREQAAIRATLPPYKTVEVNARFAPMSAIGNAWSRACFDGDFYRSARPFAGDLPLVNLVFVESRDHNTGA